MNILWACLWFVVCGFVSVLAPLSAHAEKPTYLPQPICFTIINHAPYSVYGDAATAEDVAEDGTPITHTATFRLKENEREPVCTTGPLFEGNRIRITLRTLFPIFECKTMIYPGAEINIQGALNKDGLGSKTWVECL
ncbi:MAG: hypothetical protein H6855_01510 [Rhodospirillales bacterium]|nr:hypothetical protein [Rhodospirillales bacterium]MCB9964747.1 hypothetical protein [Rhodospirillales bacterium]